MRRRTLLVWLSLWITTPTHILALPAQRGGGGGGGGEDGGGRHHHHRPPKVPEEPIIWSHDFPSKLDRSPPPPHWAEIEPQKEPQIPNSGTQQKPSPDNPPPPSSPPSKEPPTDRKVRVKVQDWSDRFPVPVNPKRLFEFRNIQCAICMDECTRYHIEDQDPASCLLECTTTLQNTFVKRLTDIPQDLKLIARHMECTPDDQPDEWLKRREPSSPQPSQPRPDDGPSSYWMSLGTKLGRDIWGGAVGAVQSGRPKVQLPTTEQLGAGLAGWGKKLMVPVMGGGGKMMPMLKPM